MTIKCKSCGKTETYEHEGKAHLNGWYLESMNIGNYVVPKGAKICYSCGKSAGQANSNMDYDYPENED